LNRLRTYWVDQAKWWCSRSLEWWAAHLTALYVGGAITIMGARFDELRILKLNEIGDLAAGVFGPVAFLWLILGYVQQGRELKVSSDALRMQASEFKALVEAQNAMLENHERALDPLLIVTQKNGKQTDDGFSPLFEVVNNGEYCSDVRGIVRGGGGYTHGIAMSPLVRGGARLFSCGDLKEDGQYVLEIEYEKTNRKSGKQSFLIYKYTDAGTDRTNIQAYNAIARFSGIPSEKYRL